MARLVALLLVSSLLGACSSGTPTAPTASSTTPAPAATNVLAGTPMAAYGHALNKAKSVQNIVDRQARKQAAAINAATGSTSGGP